MTREKSCFVFAIFNAVVIVSLCHFNSWIEAWRCSFKFLKANLWREWGSRIDPSIWLSKPYSGHVFGFQVQSVNGNLNGTAKRKICTGKWSTGAQMVECKTGDRKDAYSGLTAGRVTVSMYP